MRPSPLALGALALLTCHCGGVPSDSGLHAKLQVTDAQYFKGSLNRPAGGPDVLFLSTGNVFVRPGQQNKGISGKALRPAEGVALALAGDEGYWIRPTGLADREFLDQVLFSANVSFSASLPLGEHQLTAYALDAAGRVGASSSISVIARDLDPDPDGVLVVSLSWDVNADLDLHVVDPNRVEIWARNISSYRSAGGIVDPEALAAAGVLDFDSNAQCVIDGRRRENVYWKRPPPRGHYLVRVDTASLCGEAIAYWRVRVMLAGQLIAEAHGIGTEVEASRTHDVGAGTLAVQFDVP